MASNSINFDHTTGTISSNADKTVSVNDKILVFDCGMKYAPDKMYGVDYVIPDFEWLKENKDRIRK